MEILDKPFIFVTGKGGSGKSVLSLAIAHRLSCRGKNVLLVELGRRRDRDFSRLPELAGLKSASHNPQEIGLHGDRKIFLSVLDPTKSLAEYVDLKLPTAGLAGILLNNRVTASFLEVVPGLPDLVSLGKLWYLLAKAPPSPTRPDVIVLDAPASGHALALLQAPKNFEQITKVGPIHKDAEQMVDFFSRSENTGIALTTLPEEMSVQETLELSSGIRDFPKPHIFVNRHFPPLPALKDLPEASPLFPPYEYSRKRSLREAAAIKDLPKNCITLPFLFPQPDAPPLYARLSELLK